jgi:hypothetical protein
METSKLQNTGEFKWIAEGKNFFLKSNENTVLELTDEKSTKASFEWDTKTYKIQNEGFWNPITTIKHEDNKLLNLRRNFLGNKGTIEFASGNQYTCIIKNSPLVNLIFMTESGKEFLSYEIKATLNPNSVQSILTVLPNSISREELILLIVLGFYSFKGIIIENQTSDLIIMTATS